MTKLQDIFGQDAAVEAISAAYRADRLPHGLIFCGPSGVGKATTARALANLFLCDKPIDVESGGVEPCGVCLGCQAMEAGNHPDYHVITKELIRYHDKTGKSKGIDLSIQVLRPELIDPAGRKSSLGRGKVFIIEQAELMNDQAQNAILKTLEEPAGRTIIVLLTSDPDALTATVRSRCQVIRFAMLDEKLTLRELQKRGFDAATAQAAAELAEGSLGDALRMIQDGQIEPAQNLIGRLEGLLAGQALEDLPNWLKNSAEVYAQKQLERDELASKDAASRAGLAMYLKIAGRVFRRRLIEETDTERLENYCQAIDAIARAQVYLEANVNVSVALQQLAMSLEAAVASGALRQ